MAIDYKKEILRHTDGGLKVFNFYLPFEIKAKKKFKNPFYDDHNAACVIIYDAHSGKYYFKDFGDETYTGDCFWFVAMKYGLDIRRDFVQVMKIIIDQLQLPIYSNQPPTPQSFRQPFMPNLPQTKEKKAPMKKYEIIVKSFSDSELGYWSKYGITLPVLNKYSVKSISSFSSEGEKGPYTIISTSDSPIFAYAGDKFVKLYRPFDNCRFLYGGKLPTPYVFGLNQLPPNGDIVFIVGGEKDVLSMVSHGFNAICFNSETKPIPESIVEMLHLRFRHIILMLDCDETGIEWMEKGLVQLDKYNVLSLQLPLAGTKPEKDISDFFSMGYGASDLRNLVRQTIEDHFSQSMLLISSCEMDFNNPPRMSKVVISSSGVPIGSYDNLLGISGGEGTGKSNFISSLIAGTLLTCKPDTPIDTLGFDVTPNIDGKAVLHFDTEQSEYQLHKNTNMTLRRAGLSEYPAFYHSFFLTPKSRNERIQIIRDSMDLYHHRHNGIHLVVVDGIADLIRSANDEAESIAIVEELYRLAGIYHTCIICVLHLVPNGYKLRGHIGSELQRKAASILTIDKEEDQKVSVVKTMKVRDGNPMDVPMFMFKWDKEKNMHVFAGQKSEEDKTQRKKNDLTKVVTMIFEQTPALTYNELTDKISQVMEVAPRTAKEYISFMYKNGVIIKPDLKYCLKK